MKKILLFLFLTSVCFGDVEVAEEVFWWNTSRTFYSSFIASSSMSENVKYTWPPADAASGGQALLSNSNGVLSWGTPSTSASHNLLSASHPDTTTAAPSRGSVIVGSATSKWAELVKGAANEYLKSDGTDAIWDDIDLGTDTTGNYVLSITDGLAIDGGDGGSEGAALTIAFDPTELLGNRTWGDGSTDTITWTWDRATGTDPTITFGDGLFSLNDHALTDVDFIDFDLVNGVAPAEGRLVHNDDDGTLNYGMKGGVVNQQIGLESLIHGKNTTGSGTLDGKPARISGASGSKPEFDFSEADVPASAGSIGLFTESVANNSNGYVTTFGLVRDIDTTGTPVSEVWAAADRIYVGNTAGSLTNVVPTSTERIVFIGIVLRAHATEGVIWVNPINTSYLSELSGNSISAESNGDAIIFNSGTGLWENQTIDISDSTNLAVSAPVTLTDDTIGWDSTLIDDLTWSDGANAANTWTFDVSGTDTTMVFGDGIISFGQVTGGIFPTESSHLATKEYVDSAITFIEEYYFNDTASDIGGVYFEMLDTPTGEAQSTHTSGALGTGDDQTLFNFATIAGVPGLITLDAGIYTGHIHALKSGGGQKPVKIHFEIYSRATDTTETLLTTSEESDFLTLDETEYSIHATLAADVTIDATDRIIVKWLANVEATGGNATVLLRQEGTTAAHLSVPISSNILSQIYLRQDGTKELTDNWDAGPFDIRSQTLTADSLTSGRVPFASANGLLVDDSDLTFATDTLTATKIGAFELTGKLTAGATEIEGSNFDINGGTINGITDLAVVDGGTGASTLDAFLLVDGSNPLEANWPIGFFDIEEPGNIDGSVDATVVTDNAHVLYWGAEGTKATSAAGTGFSGTLAKTVGTEAYLNRGSTIAVRGDGATCYTSTGYKGAGVLAATSRTCMVWIRADAFSGSSSIINYGASQNWNFVITSSQTIAVQTGAGNRTSGVHVLDDGNWHHIAVVFDATIETAFDGSPSTATHMENIRVYVDGGVDATGSGSAAAVDTVVNADLTIGCSAGGTNLTDADLDEVAIIASALSASDVLAVYKAQKTNFIGGSNGASVDWTTGGNAKSDFHTEGSGTFGDPDGISVIMNENGSGDVDADNDVTAGNDVSAGQDVSAGNDFIAGGNTGLSATYSFGGGGTGDIATMTFTGGILTAVTTVPP